MSVLGNSIPRREIEGPARLFQERVPRSKLEDNPAMIGYVSMREWLTVKYGKEGVGWAVDSSRYTQSQKIDLSLGESSTDAVYEQRLVHSGLADIILYPDGEVYHGNKYEHTV